MTDTKTIKLSYEQELLQATGLFFADPNLEKDEIFNKGREKASVSNDA